VQRALHALDIFNIFLIFGNPSVHLLVRFYLPTLFIVFYIIIHHDEIFKMTRRRVNFAPLFFF